MRVKIDHKRKIIDLDTTDGENGSTTSAGHMAMFLCRDFCDVIVGWAIGFFPEEDGYTFEGGVVLKSIFWGRAVQEIVDLIKAKYCDTCGQELKE